MRKSTKQLDKELESQYARNKAELEIDKIDMDAPVSVDMLVPKQVQEVTVEQLRNIYPKKVNDTVLANCANKINEYLGSMNSIEKGIYKDNVFTFLDILADSNNRVGIDKYLNAVKFCMYKMQGNTDVRSYSMTFPDKIQKMANEKIPNSYLYAYAQAYAKSKLVVQIMTKMMIPAHIQFQDIFTKAVMVQASIMDDDTVSPKVRSDAANSLMTHLKQPEIKQMELQVNTSDTGGAIDKLTEALQALTGKQRELILEGEYTVSDIAKITVFSEDSNDMV